MGPLADAKRHLCITIIRNCDQLHADSRGAEACRTSCGHRGMAVGALDETRHRHELPFRRVWQFGQSELTTKRPPDDRRRHTLPHSQTVSRRVPLRGLGLACGRELLDQRRIWRQQEAALSQPGHDRVRIHLAHRERLSNTGIRAPGDWRPTPMAAVAGGHGVGPATNLAPKSMPPPPESERHEGSPTTTAYGAASGHCLLSVAR